MSTKKPTINWHATRGRTPGSQDSRRPRLLELVAARSQRRQPLIDKLQLRSEFSARQPTTCTTTGKSTTVSKNWTPTSTICTTGTSTTLSTHCTATGTSTTLSKSWTTPTRRQLPARLNSLHPQANDDELQLRNLHSFRHRQHVLVKDLLCKTLENPSWEKTLKTIAPRPAPPH